MQSTAPLIHSGSDGRPPYDRDWFAQDIISWAEDEDSWDIKQWRIKHRIPRQRVMEMCADSDRFRDSYAYAMDCIALRRAEMNRVDELKDSLYSQHMAIYDKDKSGYDEYVKDQQLSRDLKKLEKEIQLKMAQGTATDEEQAKLSAMNSLIDELQAMSSKRKKASTSINADTKS